MDVNPKLKSHSSKKISSLYEVEYSEDKKIQPTHLPVIKPYLAYQKPSTSGIRNIRSLIHSPPKTVKEYVQSSSFDKHYITGLAAEQFVTLEIPSEFPKGWIDAGYSHIHFGAVRLALNYHGSDGKAVVARIALLDTRYLTYQDACIGTVEATMNNGLVMVTLFPNFTIALKDPNLMDALKVQIHIVGAQQVESSIIATLHYQFVYRIQDHSFRLDGCGSNDSLLITVNTQEQPHCVHVPRRIPRDKLIQLLPERWVTSYDQIHATKQPIRSTNTKIISKGDGTSEIRFDHSHLKDSPTPLIFPTQMMMTPRGDLIQTHDKEDPDCWCELCHPGVESKMIEFFDAEGKPILFYKDLVTGYCPWDMECSCEQCVEEDFVQEIEGRYHTSYNPHKKKKNRKKNSIHSQLYQRWKNGDPTVGPLGEDNGQDPFYYVEQKNQEIQRLKDHIKYLQEHGLPPSAQSGETLFPNRSTPSSVFSPFETRTPLSPPSVFHRQPVEPKRLAPYELRDLIRKQEADQKREREERERKGKSHAVQEKEEPVPKVSRSMMIKDGQQNPLSLFLKGYKEAIIPRITAINTEETE
ncbi:hypothetical protein V6N11_020653 [Hibiscus sabdariffa]|uniref:Uncharacterized protein n=1 Tax=Hibiscus sabdariffa TaxID=183260 RepID=A0ABR2Q927_9ROSI